MKVLLYDNFHKNWCLFSEPVAVLKAESLSQVEKALKKVEEMVKEGYYYAAGFIAYEAAPAFDSAFKVKPALSFLPLVCFGVYRGFKQHDISLIPSGNYTIGRWAPNINQKEYLKTIQKVKEYIKRGDTYQVNYTFLQRTDFKGNAAGFFRDLVANHSCPYAAYIETGELAVLSASPELFFYHKDNKVVSRPMKGTIPRGRTIEEDKKNKFTLFQSEKNRAENLMIVDMIRNDLGRIAAPGSVEVPALYNIEHYPYVIQMTSTVKAETGLSLTEIFKALFPCASITGAPKVRTMKIISELEKEPRGIYTGTLGYSSPAGFSQFNVAIRTVVIDKKNNQAYYGVGGGIVWDSEPLKEYEECKIKSGILFKMKDNFELLESLLHEPHRGYFLLQYHLNRLRSSAEYFYFFLDMDRVIFALNKEAEKLNQRPKKSKVRLLVNKEGTVRVESEDLENNPVKAPLKVVLSKEPVHSENIFLFHKTTKREVYHRAKESFPNYSDVILWNEKGELT
jgi:para-aminobenzoate synthetase/4-amino-4-deoxychorismate lyase